MTDETKSELVLVRLPLTPEQEAEWFGEPASSATIIRSIGTPVSAGGLETVRWGPSYTMPGRPSLFASKRKAEHWATTPGRSIVAFVSKSDAAVQITLRDVRIAELQSENARLTQDQAVISAAIAVARSEHGVDAELMGGDPLAFEPCPEMDALLVALDAARPGWRDTARSTAPQPQAAQPDRERLNGVPSAVVQAVAELPDRTSPDDDSDTMLVTTDELASIVLLSIANAMDQEGSGNA